MATTSIDPITQEVLAAALKGIAEEMAVVEYRSSFSPIIREMLDFNCGLFDGRGGMVSHSEQIPAQLGLMQFALEAALERWGDRGIGPGDAILINDPYMGGTHTPDLQVFVPIVDGDETIGYAGSIAHHIDIGGRVPGTVSAESTEIFHEGLIFQAIKLVDAGVRNEAVLDIIRGNVRDPAATISDLDAQLAACARGVERVHELCRRYGRSTVTAAMERLLEQTAARAQAAFRRWDGRSATAEGLMDDGGFRTMDPARIHVRVAIADGRLTVDLSGTDAQVRSGINVPLSSTHAAVYFAVRCFIGGDIAQNAGLASTIDVQVPDGSLLNPAFPGAVSGRHLTVQKLSDVLIDSLSQIVPEKAMAGSQVAFPALVFQALDPRTGQTTLFTDILGGGGGARPDAAGDNGIDTYTGNIALLSAEIAELEYPWRIERTSLEDGSGGEGARRGGLAMRRDYRLLGPRAEGTYYVEQTKPASAPRGRAGGGPGATARVTVRRAHSETDETMPSKGYIHLSEGDIVTFVSSGGGGDGTPGDDTTREGR